MPTSLTPFADQLIIPRVRKKNVPKTERIFGVNDRNCFLLLAQNAHGNATDGHGDKSDSERESKEDQHAAADSLGLLLFPDHPSQRTVTEANGDLA